MLVVALVVGGLVSGTFSRLGLFAYVANGLYEYLDVPQLVGLTPAMVHAEDWQRFKYDDIRPGALDGKVAIITGANIGLGKEHAWQLAIKGATVVAACRNEKKCSAAAKEINDAATSVASKGSAVPMILDTSSFSSVRKFLLAFKSKFSTLDIFVMNAGIAFTQGNQPEVTADGIEKIFHTNHVGHFQMLMGLKKVIEKTAKKSIVRIVAVSSAAHYAGDTQGIPKSLQILNSKEHYDKRYGLTKLANVLLANEIPKRFENSFNIISTSCHPGAVASNIWTQLAKNIEERLGWSKLLSATVLSALESIKTQAMFTPYDGALTQVYLSTLATKQDSGAYFHPIAIKVRASARAQNPQESADLWTFSLELVKNAAKGDEKGEE